MLAKTRAAQVVGLEAHVVDVEVDVSPGLHSFSIVGLPDKAVEEARDRISAAIKNSGFSSPQKGNRKVIVSLSPAELKKEGAAYDLAIALGHLLATRDIVFDPEGKLFLGELSLDGSLRPIRGTLALTRAAARAGFSEIFVPRENAREAALVSNIKVYGVGSLRELIVHLVPQKGSEEPVRQIAATPPTTISYEEPASLIDFNEVHGQHTAKRGLEIAAAGGHNIAMQGPPGTGKTMLARAFTGILPALHEHEVLEVTSIHSSAGALGSELITHPPLRAPHHTASYVAMVGGGAIPRPGEVTLAHRGVLFLDEFPEFERRVIESLRQPLEDRVITISRARGSLSFPASFILVATMNPCPCGNRGVRGRECRCSPGELGRYERKISGPIVDRIDLWLDVPHVPPEKLAQESGGEASALVRARVLRARERQRARFRSLSHLTQNAQMSVRELKRFAPLNAEATEALGSAATALKLSARVYHRIIKLARTIADLAGADAIEREHVLEALQYRPKLVER